MAKEKSKHDGGAGNGRPKYNESMIKLAEAWSFSGLTDVQISEKLGISEMTINEWKNKYPEFKEALLKGKNIPDDEVELSLFKRARGFYTTKETIEDAPSNEMVAILMKSGLSEDEARQLRVVRVITKEHAPDTTAGIYWTKNRRPEKWREKHEVEHSGDINVTLNDD